MTSLRELSSNKIARNALISVLAVALAVGLPQLLHLIGRAAGVGSALGEILLPMHLPVFFAALLCGPVAGFAVGALSPVLSYAISGMPSLAMLPFMTVELAVYGLVLGLLAKTEIPTLIKLIIAMVAGRAFKALAIVLAVYAFGSGAIGIASVWNSLLLGLPGIAIQLVVIPLAMSFIDRRGKAND